MRALRHLLWSFGRDLQGGVAIIGAAAVVLFVVLAALAIDLGSMTLKAREIQGAADLAALSAARNLPAANAAANATAQANLGADIIITTQTGVYLA
ncbi:pilus assembly protein TadG-related protein [Brevundimonas sp.]|nr:pilus assembly protein TadG-related protein [Brevundimonas sp.]